jgi:uncharacterized repeat protein (TIGR02543 family)
MGIFFWNSSTDPTNGGHVIRDNVITGVFKDGIGGSANGALSGGSYQNTFIYRNYVEGTKDDGIEIESADINSAVWENVIKNTSNSGIAFAPCIVGPLYILRNTMIAPGQTGFKIGGDSFGKVYAYHNTIYVPTNNRGIMDAGHTDVVGNQDYRNNIIVSGKQTVWQSYIETTNTYRYNSHWRWGGDTTQLVRWGHDADWPDVFRSLEEWQTVYGQGINGINADPLFVNPATQGFQLQSGSPAIDRGVILPGFNDANSPWPYSGSAPDMGAFEFVPRSSQTHTLTMAVKGSGSTEPAVGNHEYAEETVVNITARNDSWWQFDGWTGDVDDTNSATTAVTIDSDKMVTANWKPRYHLSLRATPPGITSINGEGWHDQGTKVSIEAVQEISPGDTGTRYVFSTWIIDNMTRTGNPISITMDSAHELTATYKMQHYLAIESEYGDPHGAGWYDSGSTAKISLASSDGIIIRHLFTKWSGDSLDTTPVASILMDKPKTVVANWRTNYSQLYILIGIIVVLAGAASLLAMKRRRKM